MPSYICAHRGRANATVWRYTVRYKIAQTSEDITSYDCSLESEKEGLNKLPNLLVSKKRELGDRIRCVALERLNLTPHPALLSEECQEMKTRSAPSIGETGNDSVQARLPVVFYAAAVLRCYSVSVPHPVVR